MRNQDPSKKHKYHPDTIPMDARAILILGNIETDCAPEILDKASIYLQNILHTKNLKLLEKNHEKFLELLHFLSNEADKADEQGIIGLKHNINENIRHLNHIVEARKAYLRRLFSYFQFWSAEQWPHLNLLFIIVPLIVGIFIPPVGIAALTFLVIYTAINLIDLSVQSVDYWQWQDLPLLLQDASSLIDQENLDESDQESATLIEQEGLDEANQKLAALLRRPEENFVSQRLNDILYYGDVIAIIICVIGLVSLIFPPVGIPILALSILTFIALGIGVTQSAITIKQQAAKHAEYDNLATSSINFDELKTVYRKKYSNESTHEKEIELCLNNQLDAAPKPKPPSDKEESEEEGESEGEGKAPGQH